MVKVRVTRDMVLTTTSVITTRITLSRTMGDIETAIRITTTKITITTIITITTTMRIITEGTTLVSTQALITRASTVTKTMDMRLITTAERTIPSIPERLTKVGMDLLKIIVIKRILTLTENTMIAVLNMDMFPTKIVTTETRRRIKFRWTLMKRSIESSRSSRSGRS